MNSKNNVIKIILLIAICILAILSILFLKNTNYIGTSNKSTDSIDLEVNNSTTFSQKIRTSDKFQKIGFLISSDLKYVKKGNIIIKIYDNDKLVSKKKIKANKIVNDNYYFKYYYVNYNFKKNKNYRIDISFVGLSDTLKFKITSDKIMDGKLMIDDESSDKMLSLSLLQKSSNKSYIWYYLLVISILLTIKAIKK